MSAFVFVPLLVVAWMLGLAVSALASHYFLTIVESSATPMARNLSWDRRPFREWIRDGIEWPDDLYLDYFAKTFYLGYLIVLWAGPAVLIGRLSVGDSPWATVIAGAAFWLLFPLGLLSSMASQSRWTPFRFDLLIVLARRPLKTLGFYLLSAPVLAVIFLTFDLLLLHTSKASALWAATLSPVAVVMFFIYARLLGRFGMVVVFTLPELERSEATARPKRRKRKKPVNAYDPATRPFIPKDLTSDDPPVNAQPADLPPIETPYDGPVTGYGVDYSGAVPEEVPPPPRPVYPGDEDEDNTPFGVEPPPEISTDREKVAAELAKPSKRELDLVMRDRPTEPTNPYGPEAVTFLLDPKTLAPWLTLTLGLIAMAMIQRGLDLVRPE